MLTAAMARIAASETSITGPRLAAAPTAPERQVRAFDPQEDREINGAADPVASVTGGETGLCHMSLPPRYPLRGDQAWRETDRIGSRFVRSEKEWSESEATICPFVQLSWTY